VKRFWIPAAVTGVILLTTLFFLTKATILQDFVTVGESVQAIDPGETVSP
jgi:hypothetical protein